MMKHDFEDNFLSLEPFVGTENLPTDLKALKRKKESFILVVVSNSNLMKILIVLNKYCLVFTIVLLQVYKF